MLRSSVRNVLRRLNYLEYHQRMNALTCQSDIRPLANGVSHNCGGIVQLSVLRTKTV